MLSQKKLQRINELAHKAKKTTLTKAEKEEQKKLRKEYLEQFKQSFKRQISNVRVFDPEGKDVTPEKIKDLQNKQNE